MGAALGPKGQHLGPTPPPTSFSWCFIQLDFCCDVCRITCSVRENTEFPVHCLVSSTGDILQNIAAQCHSQDDTMGRPAGSGVS